MLLIMERAFSYELIPKNLSLLRKIARLFTNGQLSLEKLKQFCSDKISSRVMETFIYSSKKSALQSLLDIFLIPNVDFFLQNDTANYTLQAFLTHCTHKQLPLRLFDSISTSPVAEKGLEPKRIGVLYKLVKSDLIPATSTHRFLLASIRHFFKPNKDELSGDVLALLTPNTPPSYKRGRPRHLAEDREFHPVGCAILVHLFSSGLTADSEVLLEQFIGLPINTLFRLAMDPSGSRVLDATFSSPMVGKSRRDRLFKKLLAASLAEEDQHSIAMLAENTFGSRVIETIFVSIPMEQKTILAQYLSDHMKEFRKPRSKGQYVIKSCMLEEFILSKTNWTKMLAELQKKRASGMLNKLI